MLVVTAIFIKNFSFIGEASFLKESQPVSCSHNIIIVIAADTKTARGLCLRRLGVVLRQEHTSRIFEILSLSVEKESALSFEYFNSWPVILTDLPAVVVACRRCETRS